MKIPKNPSVFEKILEAVKRSKISLDLAPKNPLSLLYIKAALWWIQRKIDCQFQLSQKETYYKRPYRAMFWKLKKLIQENLFEEVKIFVMLSKQLAYSLTQRDTKCVFYAHWLQNEISKTPPGYFYRRNNAKIKQRHFFWCKKLDSIHF